MANVNLEKQMNCTAIMNLKEVGVRIGRKDIECIKKWLNENNVTVHRLGKLTCIYKVDFECSMMLPQIKDYKRKYPTQWEAFFQKTIKDETLFNLIMLRMEVEINFQPTTKVRRSKSDDELYKQLLS